MPRKRIAQEASPPPAARQNNPTPGKGLRAFPPRKRIALGSAMSIAAILCAYRISTFVPQPLDAPSTLRPILYGWFARFVRHYSNPEEAQQAWGSYCLVCLSVPVVLAVLNYLFSRSIMPAPVWVHKIVASRLALFLSVAACLIVCRFPALLRGEINPDETLFLAAARQLFWDPVFFRAVDCGTSGPINVLPLMLPGLFGISPDYTSTRLIGLGIIFASVYLIYRVLALLTDDATARIAVLPAAGAFAVLKHADFLHYSSEHVSFVLLSLSLYMCVGIFRNPKRYTWKLVGLGLLSASAFLAKMQAVPILCCVSAAAAAYVHWSGYAGKPWRPALLFGTGVAPLLVLNAAVCVAAGVWNDFWMEYIVGNYHYVQNNGAVAAQISQFSDFVLRIAEIRALIVTLVAILAAYAFERMQRGPLSDLVLFVRMGVVGGVVAIAATALLRPDGSGLLASAAVIGIAMLPGVFFLLYQDRDDVLAPVRWFGFVTAAVGAVAAATVYLPHRQYVHYLLLLVFPLTIAMAWPLVAAFPLAVCAAGNAERSRDRQRSFVPFVLLFATLVLLRQLSQAGSPDSMAFAAVPMTVRAPESELIDALTGPAGKITVWGWNARPYLGAGRASATVDFNMSNFFVITQQVRAYYRAAYLSGLQRHRPELFIDAIDTSHGGFANRKAYGFEQIPEINTYVQANYMYLLSAYGQRFYIRRDLAQSDAGVGDSRKCDAQAIRCFAAGVESWIPADLPPIQMPQHALLEVTFTPETTQDMYTTVFSNQSDAGAHEGFQLQHLPSDKYRVVIGWGPEWAVSEMMVLPQRKPAYLSVEFNGDLVTVVCNGVKRDEMRLPKRMQDSAGAITVGSWIGHQRPFLGNIQFFQIRDLGREAAKR